MTGVTIEENTARRMANATRFVEEQGIDLRGSQLGNRPRPSTGDAYNGVCKAVNTSDVDSQKIKIVDGLSDDYATETSAGNLQINKFNFNLLSDEFIITEDVLIYIESILVFGDGEALPATSATAEIKSTTATTLTYEAGKEKTLISRVKFSGSTITKFSQENVNPRIFVTNEC